MLEIHLTGIKIRLTIIFLAKSLIQKQVWPSITASNSTTINLPAASTEIMAPIANATQQLVDERSSRAHH